MPSKSHHIRLTVLALAALAALILGLLFSQHWFKRKPDVNRFHGTLLNTPRKVSDFDLTAVDHHPFTNKSLNGQWTVVFFGFTRCGYLCPTTMAKLGQMYRILEEKEVKNLPQVVMITIDPERDDLDKLGQYVKRFHPDFMGARGPRAAIKHLTKEFGIAYAKVAKQSDDKVEDYDIEHTGTLLLFNPDGELSAFFTTPHHAENLAEDYQLLIS